MSNYYYIASAKQRRNFQEEDFKIFLAKLEESLYVNNATLYAFSFLPPRFHLLLESREPKIDKFMQHINVSFAMALKLHRNHKGPLFSGRYSAYPFTNKNLLLPISQYIHLLHRSQNPKLGLIYSWSSLPGYLNEKKAIKFIKYETLLAAAGGRKGYERKLRALAKETNPQEELAKLLTRLGASALGETSLRGKPQETKTKILSPKKEKEKKIKPEVVLEVVAQAFGLKKEVIAQPNSKGKIRGIAAEFLLKFCQLTQNEIGKILGGIGYSAISHLRYRMREKMKSDKNLTAAFQQIEKKLIGLAR